MREPAPGPSDAPCSRPRVTPPADRARVAVGRRVGRALTAATALLVGGTLLAGCTDAGTGTTPPDVVDQGYQSGDGTTTTWPVADRGEPIELSGTDFEGVARDVSDWRGDVVLLNTWYAACPPCRAEAPDLVAVAEDYAADGLQVLGINGRDDAGAAQPFQRTFGVPYPSIEDTDHSVVAALQGYVPVNAVPTTVLLDREGRVAARVIGLVDASTLRTIVDDLLAETAGAGA